LHTRKEVTAAWIQKPDGRVIATFAPDDARPADTMEPPPINLVGVDWQSFRKLTVTLPIRYDNETIGRIGIRADFSSMLGGLLNSLLMAALCSLLAFALAIMLTSRLLRAITLPIEQLAASARAVAAEKTYNQRVEKHSSDELGDLVDRFNEMLGEIESRDRALQDYQSHLEDQIRTRTWPNRFFWRT
jgi:methyl-accepting chemotaxis protein